MFRSRCFPLLALVGLASLLPSTLPAQKKGAAPAEAAKPALDPAHYASLKYRYLGPEGNRITTVTGVAGDPNTYYGGAASGGMFKTTDGGIHWTSIFDEQTVSSVGALAVAPSDPNVVWAGTGEPFIRSHISVGWGVFKSTDAGKTWNKMGLENTGRIARFAIDPRNPDVVFVAALGHAYGPQPERGIYRTTDGGKTWEKVLFVNDSTGAVDILMDPTNPRILYAGTWQIEIHTWGRTSGGAGSGIWKSTDGGTTWTRLKGNGLPTKVHGKVGLGISKANPNRIYALIETSDGVPLPGFETERGELWRSEDAGATWQVVSYDRQLGGRTHYYNRMMVTPDNENEAYFLTSDFSKTIDGGRSTVPLQFSEYPGGDHHDMWIDPTNGNRQIVSHDGGISISTNRGKTWLRVQLPVAQMYHVTTDNQVPYTVCGNRQDGPSACGPSNSKTGGFFGMGGISRGMWFTVAGGESGWATPDPEDPNTIWSSASGYGSSGGVVTRYDRRTGIAQNVEVWPGAAIGHPAADVKYRFVWTFPLTISPHNHNMVYVGSQFVHVTTDGGRSWQIISPDLTRNDKTRQQISGGLTPDNIGVEYSGVIFAIAESRLEKGLIWAGTNDGQVQLTRDGGKTWTNVTANLPGMLYWGTVSNIEASRYAAGTAYLSVDGHQVNNRDPWIYKTTDYGKTWKLIVTGIEKSPLSYAHVVREDPVRQGLLYAGTENGLYVSFNDGDSWQPLQNNLPHAPVYWITIQEHFSDLVVATYGRGLWILDDITPLRQLTAESTAKEAVLMAPRLAYRLKNVEPPFAAMEDPTAGSNPQYGASLTYWLKTEPKDSVTLKIADASGKVVRTMTGPKAAGLNRVWWDLRNDMTKEIKLRTSPLYVPDIAVPEGGRSAPDGARISVLQQPGSYTVTLSVAGQEYAQKLELRKDPNSGGSEEEVRAQTALMLQIQADEAEGVELVHSIELARSQLVSLKGTLAGDSTRKDIVTAADSLEQKLIAVEGELLQLQLTGRGQDDVRYPMRLLTQLGYLASGVEASDFAPTTQQSEVQQMWHTKVAAIKGRLDQLVSGDLKAFNAMLAERKVAGVVVR